MVVKRPQFLWQQQLHFIHESVVGGPQASGAGSCHRGGLGIDSSRVGAPLCPRSWLTTKGGSSLSLCSAGASASALGRPSPALAARGEAPVGLPLIYLLFLSRCLRCVPQAGLDLAMVQPPDCWDCMHGSSRPVFSFDSRGVSKTTSAASVMPLQSIKE